MPAEECNGLKRYLIRLAVSVIGALLIQTATLAWWGGTINTKVQAIEKDLVKVEKRITTVEEWRMAKGGESPNS